MDDDIFQIIMFVNIGNKPNYMLNIKKSVFIGTNSVLSF
jgi:hypothetical protein